MSDNTITFFYSPQREDSKEDDDQHQPIESVKPLGFNFLNSNGIWEPLAHGAHSWESFRFYELPPNHFPVKYSQDGEDFVSKNPSFPRFHADYLENTECLSRFFQDGYTPSCFVFVIFTSNDLRSFGIEVPDDHTGYQIDMSSGNFVRVPMPPNHGWNQFLRCYEQLCTVEHVPGRECTSGLLGFWENYGSYMTGRVPPFCSPKAHTPDEASSSDNPLRLLCSRNRGPCCIEGCYCYDCGRFYPPVEAEDHDSAETRPGSGYFTRKCDKFYSPR